MDKPRPNKHAAKAKKHIYSSGAAGTGGKAEPTNAKNAGQPVECPFCDRIFKQDGRLKEHVKNKHADGVNCKTGADAATAPVEGASSAPGVSAVLADTEAAQPKYFVKSPKQMLSEWCQKQKRPLPKYKAVQVEGGMFRCRVVIPDAKDSEKDILLWWNDGASVSEDAQQGAAVAGLHAVAGERRMDRILLEEFREQWRTLDERAVQHQERERKQAERKAAAAKRPPPPRRTVQSVFMSEDNRQLVEGLIRDSQPAPHAWPETDVSSGWEPSTSSNTGSTESCATDFAAARSGARPTEADISTAKRTSAGVVGPSQRLLAMGFSEGDVSEAVRSVGSSASFGSLVDWLVLHVAESRLPKQFRPEASGAHVEIVRKGPGTGGATQATSLVGQYAGVSSSCREVMERGSSRHEAERALENAGGDVDAALCILSRSTFGETGAAAAVGMGGAGGVSSCSAEELQEERVALEAIYADDFSELAAADGVTLCVRLPSRGAGEERTRMEFRFPASCHYPQDAPCISFRNSRALPGWLRRLTVLALTRAQELLGEPMLWALVEGAIEDVATLDMEDCTPDGPERVLAAYSGASERRSDGHCSGMEQSRDSCGSGSIGLGLSRPSEQAPSQDQSQRGEGRPSNSGGQRQGGAAPRISGSRREGGAAPPMDVQRESERLQQHRQRWLREGRYSNMRQARASLPAAKQKGQLMDAIEGPDAGTTSLPRVTIVCGQTGCGKSTQVPQYILEQWTERQQGGKCNVVVTQPRRVAAIGLAERVAAERGEKVGETVGYSVRLESKRCARTRLLFCTTGVLLRRMQGEQGLAGVSHVIVDEVHERTVEGDLMLLLLRTLISDGRKDLTVVLMSATADAAELRAYFGSGGLQAAVSVVSIPGFTHPVRELYLEDVLEMTGEVIGARSRYAKRKPPGRNEREGGKTDGRQVPARDMEKPPKEVSQKEGRSEIPRESKLGKASSSRKAAGGVKESWDADEESENEDFKSEKNVSQAGVEVEDGDWAEADTSGGLPAEALQSATAANAAPRQRPDEGKTEGKRAEPGREYSEATRRSVENVEEEMLNYELVEKVVCKILEEEQRPATSYAPLLPPLPAGTPDTVQAAGAILVFLPGMAEIRRLERQLTGSQRLAAACGGRLWVLPLHGSLSGEQQRKVFDRPPAGHRKIVLSTNVAETSLTIDDVTYVVDIGRQREMCFDPNRALACLEDVWVSQASAQQRRGRAGRARPGCCIRMFTRRTFARMATQQAPEVLRTSLDQLCLQVKSLLPDRPIASVLGDLLSPPSPAAIATALTTLVDLRALSQNPETLTPLGRHLARMPVDVRVGKMLVMGAVLGCPGPASTIAAALSGKSPFNAVPPDLREEADRVKARLAGSWKSDHLAVVAAFEGWKTAGEEGGWRAQQDYCQAHFLSRESLQSIAASRADYLENLADLGFIPRGFARGHRRDGEPDPDVNALNYRVVKAVLCAGFYPNVVRVQLPEQTYKETSGGAMAKDAKAREVRFYTKHDGRVFLHPASTNFSVGRFESPWLVYSEKVRTSKIFIRESSMVPAYALLLFGGEISVAHEKQSIAIDNWMHFEAPAKIAVLICKLRNQVDRLLADKIENPALDVTNRGVVAAVVKLLTNDGF